MATNQFTNVNISTLKKGTAVFAYTGTTIDKALAGDNSKLPFLGLLFADTANNAVGSPQRGGDFSATIAEWDFVLETPTGTGLTANTEYWLSDTTAGKITQVKPTVSANQIRIGYSISTTQLSIDFRNINSSGNVEGTALENLDNRLDAVETAITDLDGRLDTAENNINSLDGRLDTVESSITSLDNRLDTAETDIINLDGRIDNLEVLTNLLTKTNENVGSLVKGNLVYSSSLNKVNKAQANSINTSKVLGMVTNTTVASNATATIQNSNIFIFDNTSQVDAVCNSTGGFTFNTYYYLDTATAGKMTSTIPTNYPNCLVRIGLALSTTSIKLDIQDPIERG